MIKKLIILIFLLSPIFAWGQNGNAFIRISHAAPTVSTCSYNLFVNDVTNGNLYFCQNGSLVNLASGTFIGAGGLTASGLGNSLTFDISDTSFNAGILFGVHGDTGKFGILTFTTAGAVNSYVYNDFNAVGNTNSTMQLLNKNISALTIGDGAGNLSYVATNVNTLDDGTAMGNMLVQHYSTKANCVSSASPAACIANHPSSGVAAVPTGVNPTLVISNDLVTANSRIFLNIDESATGLSPGVTCNTTLATLVQPVVTARSAGNSFTIQIGATITVNPVCVSWFILD